MDYRNIPSIERLRQRPAVRRLEEAYGHDAIVEVLREEVEVVRRQVARLGDARDQDAIAAAGLDEAEAIAASIDHRVELRLRHRFAPSLTAVINATGVVVHTNLGRAPLSAAAVVRVGQIAGGYSTLEYDPARGERGTRDSHVSALLARLTGAADAAVVNNNAAATLLILTALARGGEVVISRGELVEIGGGFRVPEVMAQSGAVLREVGTTNRTRIADYQAAVSGATALILRVHRSNFRIEGFTEQPSLGELVALGREKGVPVVEDLGSGLLYSDGDSTDAAPPGAAFRLRAACRHEPTVRASVAAGVDLVCFSGDKLLGGPQAGIIVGRADLVTAVRRHPLMRALRVDKMVYAALDATLSAYGRGRAVEEVPVLRMLALGAEEIRDRAERVAARLAGGGALRVEIVEGSSVIGGGSAPGVPVPTALLAITSPREDASVLEAGLRRHDPPVIARVDHGRLLLDLRTVSPEQDALVAQALLALADLAPGEIRPARSES